VRVGSIIHEDLEMRKLSAKWVWNACTWNKNVNAANLLSNISNFSARSKWFPVTVVDHGRNLVIWLTRRNKATINGLAA
jgi:hypothetical protein